MFPAGTINRWEVIASFIEQHSEGSIRNAKEVLFKAKDLQSNGSNSSRVIYLMYDIITF